MTHILVVDDRADIRMSLSILLEAHQYQVIEAENPQVAQQKLQKTTIALIILDMNFRLDSTSGEEGLRFLAWLKNNQFSVPVIAMTPWNNLKLVTEAMKLGATDFIDKPWRNKHLIHKVEQQLTLASLQTENNKIKQQSNAHITEHYSWRSACMLQLFDKIKTIAATDTNILLAGAHGTGKNTLARFIQQQTSQTYQPFVSVNMQSITDPRFDVEMFGQFNASCNDTNTDQFGYLALADKGTLLFQNIDRASNNQQTKLLQVLTNGTFKKLSSSNTERLNCRIISTTSVDLKQLIKNNQFNQELYKQLNTTHLTVPALHERIQDIIPLTQYFIAMYSQKYQRDYCQLTQGAQQALQEYHWPGNIRELSQLIERAVLLNNNQALDCEDLRLSASNPKIELPIMTLRGAEITLIQKALLQTDNNIPQAAKLLGLTKSSMYRRVEKYDLAKN
ncbi:sigma-54 dependent transcriptional regulator [Thalassotalea sp. SU-HH00458]|uniref:sigma-54-dependent transcriptional regulator n=1 Tax=Thalassotalea sp. SU-HH00458 TaxID=3127657 RepID=UPI003105EEC2